MHNTNEWYQAELERTRRQIQELHALARLGVWRWEVGPNRVEWSDVMYDIAGWERGSPIDYMRYASLHHPDDAERVQQTIRRALETGKSYVVEHRIIRPDGEIRWLRGFGDVEKDENGNVVRLVGTAQDITDLLARRAAEAENERIRFLAHASAELATSLDYPTTLRRVAQLAVPVIADWCTVDILNPDGDVERVALEHSDPGKVSFVWEMTREYPPDPQSEHGVHHVIRTGKSRFVEDIPPDLLVNVAVDARHLELLRSLSLRSYIIAPLIARERVLGAITVVYAESGRRYSTEDLELVEDLARRAAVAIDNALLVARITEAQEHVEQQAAELEAQTIELEAQTEELQRRTDELAASEHRYEQILNSVNDMIFTKAYGSKVTWANRAACEYYGMTLDELQGITDVPFNELDFTQQYIRDDLQVFETGKAVEVAEEPNRSRTGEIRYFHTVKTPIFDSDGNVVELVGVSRDVTEEAEAKRAIAEANRAKSDFLAVMSHELRTPLNAMIGYSDLLLEGLPVALPEPARDSVQRIRLSAHHLLELIDDILTFSRLEAGREQLSINALHLRELANEVCAIAEPLAVAKGLMFTCACTDAVIASDARKLRQILLNLIGNAVKFTRAGGVHVEIAVTEEHGIFRVADTGIGMDADELDRIFEPFYQVERDRSKRITGTGLGLSICKRFTGLLGGSITVESTKGQGSCFVVTLPLTPNARATADAIQAQSVTQP